MINLSLDRFFLFNFYRGLWWLFFRRVAQVRKRVAHVHGSTAAAKFLDKLNNGKRFHVFAEST